MIWLHWFYFFFKKKSRKSKWYIKPFDEHYSKHFSSKLVQSEWFAKIEDWLPENFHQVQNLELDWNLFRNLRNSKWFLKHIMSNDCKNFWRRFQRSNKWFRSKFSWPRILKKVFFRKGDYKDMGKIDSPEFSSLNLLPVRFGEEF